MLALADSLIAEVERGEYNGVGFSVRNMTNMYHPLLHCEGEPARAKGGSGGGGGVGRTDAVLMRIVDSGGGGGDRIGGGVGSQVVTARLARHLFHAWLKAYADLAEQSRTFQERQ